MPRVLMRDEERAAATAPAPVSRTVFGTLAIVVGSALALAGAIDIALLWIPLNFSSIDWEFGTISATFESLPLVTISLTAVLLGVLQLPARWPAVAIGVLFAVLTVGFIAAAAIYGLTLPAVVRGTPPQLANTMKLAVAKTVLMQAIYIPLYAWLAFYSLRRIRRRRGAVQPVA